MNLNCLLLAPHITGVFTTTTANANIIQCKNAAGKLVITDNVNNRADKKATKELVQTNPSESFYNELPDQL